MKHRCARALSLLLTAVLLFTAFPLSASAALNIDRKVYLYFKDDSGTTESEDSGYVVLTKDKPYYANGDRTASSYLAKPNAIYDPETNTLRLSRYDGGPIYQAQVYDDIPFTVYIYGQCNLSFSGRYHPNFPDKASLSYGSYLYSASEVGIEIKAGNERAALNIDTARYQTHSFCLSGINAKSVKIYDNVAVNIDIKNFRTGGIKNALIAGVESDVFQMYDSSSLNITLSNCVEDVPIAFYGILSDSVLFNTNGKVFIDLRNSGNGEYVSGISSYYGKGTEYISLSNTGGIDIYTKLSATPLLFKTLGRDLLNSIYRVMPDINSGTSHAVLKLGKRIDIKTDGSAYLEGMSVSAEYVAGESVNIRPVDKTAEGKEFGRFDGIGSYTRSGDGYVFTASESTTSPVTVYKREVNALVNHSYAGVTRVNGTDTSAWAFEGSTVTLKAFPNSGYTFKEWQVENESTVLSDVTSKTATFTLSSQGSGAENITAIFEEQKISIGYTLNGGHFKQGYTAPQKYTVRNSVKLPTASNVYRAGYVFAGWYRDKALTDGPYTETGRLALSKASFYAKWIPSGSSLYEIRQFTNNCYAVISPAFAEEGETVTVKIVPNPGYEFDESALKITYAPPNGSTATGIQKVTPSKTGDLTYTFKMPVPRNYVSLDASCTAKTYTITYDTTGAENPGNIQYLPTEYNVEESYDLNPANYLGFGALRRAGYKHIGWCLRNDCSDTPFWNITHGALTGDIVLYPAWEHVLRDVTPIVTGGEYGTAYVDTRKAYMGNTVRFTLFPKEGCTVYSAEVRTRQGMSGDKIEFTKLGDFEYSFVMPDDTAFITVVFAPAYTVKLTDGDGYTLTPVHYPNLGQYSTSPIAEGRHFYFKFELMPGFVKGEDFKVLVNGTPIEGGNDNYVIGSIAENKVVTVEGVKPVSGDITVFGTVKTHGSTLDDVTVRITRDGGEVHFESVVRGNTAAYSINNAIAGNYTLSVIKNAHLVREYPICVPSGGLEKDVETWLMGDVNRDGVVDVLDALEGDLIISENRALETLKISLADMNGDSDITVSDYSAIVNLALQS